MKALSTKFKDALAFATMSAIVVHSYMKGVDMTETYKAVMMAIVMYYYGSSQSSSKKDETIRSLQDTANNKPTVAADVVNAETVETVNTNTTTVAN